MLSLLCILLSGCSFLSAQKIVGKDIRIDDIEQFYFTRDSSAYPPYFQRYLFYSENGDHYFAHETREGDHWPLTEADVTVHGSRQLSDQEWETFYDYLRDGTVKKREEHLESGGDGPWLFLYWSNDKGEYQEFTFASYDRQRLFEEYCETISKTIK